MNIYKELVERVTNGNKFKVDFKEKTLIVGKNRIIDKGIYDTKRTLIDTIEDEPLEIINELYHNYKFSLPTEKSESKRKKYFKSLPFDKLTDEQLVTGENRDLAQAKLEGFILLTILSNQFVWSENMGNWFYQSPKDKDLILLKEWF